ncbi:MAG TPA: hypothetical protein VHF06_19140 [Pseudonocardiaceae bacterium]|jgi:hypothetical protein|nr:hypothetical protein [Pseudonocardiaceae bacterium]
MAVTIPMPIRFQLPDGWQPVDPRRSGAPGAAFAAVHEPSRNGRVASITLGERTTGTSLADMADAALGKLVRLGTGVSLTHRQEYDSAVAQVATLSVGGEKLVQYQVFLALDGDHRIVLETALTATPEQFGQVAKGFGEFVSTIRLDEPAVSR